MINNHPYLRLWDYDYSTKALGKAIAKKEKESSMTNEVRNYINVLNILIAEMYMYSTITTDPITL